MEKIRYIKDRCIEVLLYLVKRISSRVTYLALSNYDCNLLSLVQWHFGVRWRFEKTCLSVNSPSFVTSTRPFEETGGWLGGKDQKRFSKYTFTQFLRTQNGPAFLVSDSVCQEPSDPQWFHHVWPSSVPTEGIAGPEADFFCEASEHINFKTFYFFTNFS